MKHPVRQRLDAWGQAAFVAALLLLLALPAIGAPRARRLEAVGAAGIDPRVEQPGTPRDRAQLAAVRDAVHRVALELVPQEMRPVLDLPDEQVDPAAWVEAALGKDPYAYATRFRILEDRGVRPALLNPNVETEYVVVVEVFLDESRVRERLAARGLLPETPETRSTLSIEVEVDSYPAYERLRQTLLGARGVHSAKPVEMSRGRVVLAVEADLEPEPLLAGLIRNTPPELRVELLGVGDEQARLRVDWVEVPANEDAALP